MPDRVLGGLVSVVVNGEGVTVPAGAMVSAALLQRRDACRVSVTGQPRTALCGMGICYECRAIIDGVVHQRSCQIACLPGMVVETLR